MAVIPVLQQHYRRYTGGTRARPWVGLVGNRPAIALAVSQERPAQRNTRLAQRLPAAAGVPVGYPGGGRSQPGERPG